jgi:hypothetical protein
MASPPLPTIFKKLDRKKKLFLRIFLAQKGIRKPVYQGCQIIAPITQVIL